MRIKVKLFATLRENRFKENEMEYPPGTTVADVGRALQIEPEEMAMILVNGRSADAEHVLSEGDTLSVFPPVGGG